MIRKSGVALLSSALLVMGLATSAMATDTPSSGLGQSWPNATDVSANPHWHVYVFDKDGIRYVQVNDLNGSVHGAIATAGGQVLVLPIGSDSQNVSTATSTTTGTSSQTVYSDSQVTISATPLSTGATQLTVTATCTGDPLECNTHLN
jgi:hypothetical protein